MNDAKPELQGPNRLTWNVDVICGNFHRVSWFLYFEYTRVLYSTSVLYMFLCFIQKDKMFFFISESWLDHENISGFSGVSIQCTFCILRVSNNMRMEYLDSRESGLIQLVPEN